MKVVRSESSLSKGFDSKGWISELQGDESYIVEFPRDDEENSYSGIKEKGLRIWESHLATSFAQSLNLKRKRETENQLLLSYSPIEQKGTEQSWKKLKESNEEPSSLGKKSGNMAEEVGLTMPHLQPCMLSVGIVEAWRRPEQSTNLKTCVFGLSLPSCFLWRQELNNLKLRRFIIG